MKEILYSEKSKKENSAKSRSLQVLYSYSLPDERLISSITKGGFMIEIEEIKNNKYKITIWKQ